MPIHFVLLVPGVEHRALLARGPCEARPPMLTEVFPTPIARRAGKSIWSSRPAVETHRGGFGRQALVLACEGRPVPEGRHRFCRAVHETDSDEDIERLIYELLEGDREALVDTYGIGAFVLLDEGLQEVTL